MEGEESGHWDKSQMCEQSLSQEGQIQAGNTTRRFVKGFARGQHCFFGYFLKDLKFSHSPLLFPRLQCYRHFLAYFLRQ